MKYCWDISPKKERKAKYIYDHYSKRGRLGLFPREADYMALNAFLTPYRIPKKEEKCYTK